MPPIVRVHITNRDTGEKEVTFASFPDAEWALLRRFVEYAEELRGALLLKREPRWTFSVRFGAQAAEVDSLPPKHEVRELALLLRPFILEGEATYFYKAVRVLKDHLSHPRFDVIYRAWSRRFNAKDSQELAEISVGTPTDKLVVNSDEALSIWLNAHVYHRDDEKRERLDKLHAGASMEVSEAFFIDQLFAKAETVLLLASLVTQLSAAPSHDSAAV